MSLTLFLPIATIWTNTEEVVIKAFSVDISSFEFNLPIPLYMGIVLAVTTLLPLVTIFLYNKRLVQIRLCVSEIVLLVGSAIFISLYCYRLYEVLSGVMSGMIFSVSFAAIMPVVSIIFVVLAIRGIAKDEALVRSLDRIR